MPEMNENVPSGAGRGLTRNGAAEEAAAPLPSVASALLSAAAIWSTSPPVMAPAQADATREPEPVKENEVQPADVPDMEAPPPRRLRPSELLAEARFFNSYDKRMQRGLPEPATRATPVEPSGKTQTAPRLPRRPQRMSLALQGGGSFGAFTWGVLERLLEEGASFDTISGASVGAINAALLACGLVQGGRDGAIRLLSTFWQRMTSESSFRSLMLVGGFSPAGSSVAFGPTLRAGQFDPFDLDPLREALLRDIDIVALRSPDCPQLLIGATRVRDGRP